jgi:hypothetical protein
MSRITIKHLENQVNRINQLTDSPMEYSNRIDNKFKANIGHYHTSQAYGGIRLDRVSNEGGGIYVVSNTGYGTKRELYNWMNAFITGLEMERTA